MYNVPYIHIYNQQSSLSRLLDTSFWIADELRLFLLNTKHWIELCRMLFSTDLRFWPF